MEALAKELVANLARHDRTAWRQALGRLPDEVPALLKADAGKQELGGFAAKFLAEDPATGRKYLFKPQAEDTLETSVTRLRRELGFPSPTVGAATAQQADGSLVKGSAKAMLPAHGTLPADPRRWTKAQVNAVLLDDPWLQLVGNLDAHVRQYVEIGHTAVNVDWDRSFDPATLGTQLDRFRQGHWYAPTAQGLLYQAYVRGELDLNLKALVKIADRLQAMPDAKVLEALDPFLTKAFAGGKPYGPYATRQAMEQALLARKSNLGKDFRELAAQLEAERKAGWVHHPVNAMRDLLMQAMEGVNGSKAYQKFSKLMQKLT